MHGKETEKIDHSDLKAAMYVRMSTDHQKYSTHNQEDAIRKYASDRNIEIIATYADEGKSGLKIDGRQALKSLIDDVQKGEVAFSIILVLDITRWGRFQDADESAYYEYICRNSGVDVQYVGEQFDNDGSPSSTIIKSVKRAMAGEYSRELSKKVFAGQCRLIKLGYRQGGPAGFGLRRMLIDEVGNQKGKLKTGEHKSLQTDRVILIPGPEDEVKTVQWMYRAFINDGMSESDIAGALNKRGVLTDLERPWTRGTIHEVLTNEKYIGNNIFNRTSHKLKKKRVVNSQDMWVRAESVFEAIVPTHDFYTIQGIMQERNRRYSDSEMLERLKALHTKAGHLSGIIIDEQCDMPSSGAYQTRFGSLIRAYKLVGYTPLRDYRYIEINRYLRTLHEQVVADTLQKIENLGTHVSIDNDSGIMDVSNELRVSIIICRCFKTSANALRWKIRLDTGYNPDISIAVRMDEDNKKPLDYYLLPSSYFNTPKIRLAQANPIELESFRCETLDEFFSFTERVQIREAA